MNKIKILNIFFILVLIVAFVLTMIGVIKIMKAQIGLEEGLKEVEEVFSSTSSSDSEESLETLVKSEFENTQIEQDSNNYLLIGVITFYNENKEYKTAVYENITKETLRKGAGRATGTSKLNEVGVCVLYGHRDSAFKALWNIKIEDNVEVKSKRKTIKYRVTNIYITNPEDNKIFEQNSNETKRKLRLVTCYPFIYSGPADERCVVELEEKV